MATTTQEKVSGNFLARIRAALKNRKKNPDWARVDEPETLLKGSQFAIFGVMITAFLVIITWTVMIGDPVQWIAHFLFALHSPLPFNQLLASFGVAVIVLINMLVTVIFILFAPVNNDDIVEMISDLDANIQERIVELENGTNEKLDEIKRNV
jgi:low affinity Fe/Cu permease